MAFKCEECGREIEFVSYSNDFETRLEESYDIVSCCDYTIKLDSLKISKKRQPDVVETKYSKKPRLYHHQ